MAERPGVFIEKGPQNFEIIQRNCDDHADIALSGKWLEQPTQTMRQFMSAF